MNATHPALIAGAATFVLVLLLTTFSCGDSSGPTSPSTGGGGNVTTSLSGIVVDENDQPVAGATVAASGQTTTTSSTGTFMLASVQVPSERCVVKCTKGGYFASSRGEVPRSGGVTSFRITLMSSATTHAVDGAAGGSATLANGSQVEIPANALVGSNGTSYSGTVNMAVRYLDPTDPSFSMTFPGGDMVAQRTDQSSTTLYSYGVLRVQLTSPSGDQLRLASGKQSTITLDIPPSLRATAPATIPLWYFDDATGVWKEEGSATNQGTKYVGTVTHFTDWNCDVPGDNGTVTGRIIDCQGNPVAGIVVRTGQSSTHTGSDGRFSRRVPTNVSFTIQVEAENNFGLTSSAVAVGPLGTNQTFNAGDISIPCPAYIVGRLVCNGLPLAGQIFVTWNGGFTSTYSAADGTFRIPVDTDKSATLYAYPVAGGSAERTFQTPSSTAGTLNLGDISACSSTGTGGNSFVINGDGYNNRTFTLSTATGTRFGFFSLEDSSTTILVSSVQGSDSILMVFGFSGLGVGPAAGFVGEIKLNGRDYLTDSDSVTANVTKYGEVGGLIEGTFEGPFFRYDSTFTEHRVRISNGMFSVIRQPNQ